MNVLPYRGDKPAPTTGGMRRWQEDILRGDRG